MSFINDITKEFSKDVVGQFIVYYPISSLYTKTHKIYDESLEKIFENPIKLDVLAGQPDIKNLTDTFGVRVDSTVEVFVQPRDLIDKGLEIFPGDYFVYGDIAYEIISALYIENIYGQVEYDRAVKLTGRQAKVGEFDHRDLLNTLSNAKDFENSDVQKTFVQQRGLSENEQGTTNDFRELRDRLGDDMADIALGEGPRKVSETEKENEATPVKNNKFYHE